MKHRQIDLLLVVNMFLTGFDAKRLNTLYIDKNLNYHGLVQAFSRTNRIKDEKKKFGKITCFRDLKKETDEALRLYSNSNPIETILMKPYEEQVKNFNGKALAFLTKFPTINSVSSLVSEIEKRDFVIMFRELLRTYTKIKGYNDFSSDDLVIEEQKLSDLKSKYLDMANEFALTVENEDGENINQDLDFELELIHRDMINVMYIIALLQDLKPQSASYKKDRELIIQTLDKDPDLRPKSKLIDDFIKKHIDGSTDEDLSQYIEAD